ncbi:MAG: hypothetical protein AAF353_00660 [Pseudomonadota bacterium]
MLVRSVFPLESGDYEVALSLSEGRRLNYTWTVTDEGNAPNPRVIAMIPESTILPANTLRIYLEFDQPMARGHVRDFIQFIDANGFVDRHAFLNLRTELWNDQQTRVSLLFDPGRLKKDVGPNKEIGTPLVAGERYSIQVLKGMKSAAGLPLTESSVFEFDAVKSERTNIDPSRWALGIPHSGSISPLSLGFNRTMDSENIKHTLWVRSADNQIIEGEVTQSHQRWMFTPESIWKSGNYEIVIHHSMEDIAGNRVSHGFDSINGSKRLGQDKYVLPFLVH